MCPSTGSSSASRFNARITRAVLTAPSGAVDEGKPPGGELLDPFSQTAVPLQLAMKPIDSSQLALIRSFAFASYAISASVRNSAVSSPPGFSFFNKILQHRDI